MRKIADPLGNLMARAVRLDTGCLVLPTFKPNRYATLKVDGKARRAHRYVFECAYGPTLQYVLHTCDFPPCFEISHLFADDQSANMLDMYSKGRSAGQKQNSCRNGHEFTDSNTRIVYPSNGDNPYRSCRVCYKANYDYWNSINNAERKQRRAASH